MPIHLNLWGKLGNRESCSYTLLPAFFITTFSNVYALCFLGCLHYWFIVENKNLSITWLTTIANYQCLTRGMPRNLISCPNGIMIRGFNTNITCTLVSADQLCECWQKVG